MSDVTLKGVWTIKRQDANGSDLCETSIENSITTNGKELFLDLMAGLSTNSFEQSNSILEITLSSGSASIDGSSADSGYPDHSTSQEITWQWSDETGDTYTIDKLRMRQGSSAGTIFTESDCPNNDPFGDADCDKPSSENWIYQYTLSISGNTTNLDSTGLDRCLRIMTDDEDNVFGGPTSGETGQLALNPENDSGTQACGDLPSGKLAPDSGYPSRSSTTLTWQYTAGTGTCESAQWDDVEVISQGWIGTTDVILSDEDAANHGTKGSNEEWQYTYDFSV